MKSINPSAIPVKEPFDYKAYCEDETFTIETAAGFYAKKRKRGTMYSNPVWYWTRDIQKARLVSEKSAGNIYTQLWIECHNPEFWKTVKIVKVDQINWKAVDIRNK